MSENICIIPARGGSKRLPRKNILDFNGEPIIARPLRAAFSSGLFSEVIVSSDDNEILSIAHDLGAHAISRPDHLAVDHIGEIETYRNVLESLSPKPEFFMGLYATSAFVTAQEIQGSFMAMKELGSDVVMGVDGYNGPHPYQAIVQEGEFWRLKFPGLNDSPYPTAVASNGSLYWFRTESFLKNPTYFPTKLSVFYTRNIDINFIEDFKRAEKEARENG